MIEITSIKIDKEKVIKLLESQKAYKEYEFNGILSIENVDIQKNLNLDIYVCIAEEKTSLDSETNICEDSHCLVSFRIEAFNDEGNEVKISNHSEIYDYFENKIND